MKLKIVCLAIGVLMAVTHISGQYQLRKKSITKESILKAVRLEDLLDSVPGDLAINETVVSIAAKGMDLFTMRIYGDTLRPVFKEELCSHPPGTQLFLDFINVRKKGLNRVVYLPPICLIKLN